MVRQLCRLSQIENIDTVCQEVFAIDSEGKNHGAGAEQGKVHTKG